MLPLLVPDATQTVDLQQTTFSHDLFGRYVCSSWTEVQNNGGDPFDIIVIGAGMHGGYIAEKLYRYSQDIGQRVLVLDAGAFLASTHLQNLPHVNVSVPGSVAVPGNDKDPGTQDIVWGYPWHSNQPFPGLAYCLGGRSLFWGGWCPRLTDVDLAAWPAAVAADLTATYPILETEIGVQPTTDYLSGPLYAAVLPAFKKAAPKGAAVGEAPLAIQGQAPGPGLVPFDKYSSADLLIDAVREDVRLHWRDNIDAWRRLMILPRAEVVALQQTGSAVSSIEFYVNGQHQVLAPPLISPTCTVILATGTIEATRLALASFPVPGMGANLMTHMRSNFTVRIKRSVFAALPATISDLEAAALIVRGTTTNKRRFHIQVTAAAIQGANPEQNMFTAIPDLDLLDAIRANQDDAWIVFTLRDVGEVAGDKTAVPGDATKSWMNLTFDDPNQRDQFGRRRAWVNFVPTTDDVAAWVDMEQQTLDLVQHVAGTGNIQYWTGSAWSATRPTPSTPGTPIAPDPIGSSHHESGTLWMGAPGSSITDQVGRFHHVSNAYVAGPALFPTAGSANPSLTALTLDHRTAQEIVQTLTPAPSPAFKPLFTGTLAGWQMAGSGDFLDLFGSILETRGGIGLLWYTREVFRNFVLTLEWLSFNATDNSGVFLRFPALPSSNPATDWQIAVDHGYEVQIDDTGFNPDTGTFHDPLHQTGAIYGLCPSSQLASKPLGQWNTYEIEATSTQIKVTLNGLLVTDCPVDPARPVAGHIGLQNHHPGSKVQFRNIQIKSLP